MPGRLFLTRSTAELGSLLGVDIPEWNDAPRHNISPGQELAVLDGEGLSRMRWGLIPVGRVNARGRPVMELIINARSETVFDRTTFAGVGRAVVPVDGWYEWTGNTPKKQAWRIKPMDGGVLLFAAITDSWIAPGGQAVPQVAMVTCEPSGDVRNLHHRMGVLLDQESIPVWLGDNDVAARELMRPYRDGTLIVELVDDVDWTAP